MSTPDLTQYVDLRIYDKDPTDILNSAIVDLKSRLPEWTPREDNTEVMLLQALAVEVADSVFAINRLPNSIITALLKLYGIERDGGAFASCMVSIEVVNSMGYTVPANTRISLHAQQGYGSIVMETTNTLVIPEGYTNGNVPVQAVIVSDAANGVPTGTRFDVLDNAYYINSVVSASPILGGRLEETDKKWFDRGVQRFGRLTDTLVVPRHFELAALELPEVTRARALDNYNADAGSGSVGDHPGHLTLALYGNSGPMSAEEKLAVIDSFTERKYAALILHTVDPVITTVNVNLIVKPNPGYTNARAIDATSEALRQWLNTDTWNWKGTVYTNELIGVVSELPEVDYVTQLVEPAADVALNGAAPLAMLGTVNVAIALEA